MSAFDPKKIAQAMLKEGAERAAHEKIADMLRDEMNRGGDGQSIVGRFLKRLRNSDLMEVVRTTLGADGAGVAMTSLGAGVAEYLQGLNLDAFIPGDAAVKREARVLLQNILPSLMVGGAEGLGDAMWDPDPSKWSDRVDNAVKKHAAPADGPGGKAATGSNALVFVPDPSCPIKDVYARYGILHPALDAAGNEQVDIYGAIILAGDNGRRFAQDWYEAQAKMTIEERTEHQGNQNGKGGNNNQNNRHTTVRTIPKPIEGYKGKVVTLQEYCRDYMPSDNAPAVRELLDRMDAANKPKKSELSKLDDEGKRFMRATAEAASRLDPVHQRAVVDYLQDVAASSETINHLGKQFPNGTFSPDELAQICLYIQSFLGGKLTMSNTLRAFVDSVTNRAGTAGGGLRETVRQAFGQLWDTAKWIVIPYLIAFAAFLVGGFFLDLFVEARVLALYMVVGGGGAMFFLMFLLTPMQAFINVLSSILPGDRENTDWLVARARLLQVLIGIATCLVAIEVMLGASAPARLFTVGLLIISALTLASGLRATGFNAEADRRLRNTLRMLNAWSTPVILLTLPLLYFYTKYEKEIEAFPLLSHVWTFVSSSSLLHSVLIVVIGVIAWSRVVSFVEHTDSNRLILSSGAIYYRPNRMVRVGLGLLVVGLALLPWRSELKSAKDALPSVQTVQALAKSALPSAPASSAKPATTPAVAPPSAKAAPTSAPKAESTTLAIAKKTDGASRKKKFNCDNVPESFKEDAGCL